MLPLRQVTARRLASELDALLADPGYANRAEPIRRRVEAEDGVDAACRAIESPPEAGRNYGSTVRR